MRRARRVTHAQGRRRTAAALARVAGATLVAAALAASGGDPAGVALGATPATAPPQRVSAPPRLRQLLMGSRLVVAGRVEQVDAFDSGRLALATVAVTQTLKGEAPASRVRVLDLTSLPSLPPLLRAGESVLLFLGPARRNSYVRNLVGEGSYAEPTGGRDAVIASDDPAAVEEAARIVAQMVAASRTPEPDATRRQAAERALVFTKLGARHGTVVEDGIAALAELRPLLPLSEEERARLAATIGRDDLPARVRERLFAQVAGLQVEAMIPALQAVRSNDVPVTAAAWSALRRLGAAPDAPQIAQLLRAGDRNVRIAAARELIARDPAGEVQRAARLAADDPEPEVRVAVSDALGQSGSPATIPVLEQGFGKPPIEAQQAAARAIFRIGGRPAQESFARLTDASSPEMQRYAVTLLRATGIADDDPLLVKVREEHPVAEVREAAEHGFPEHEH